MDGFRVICLWMGLLGNCLAYGQVFVEDLLMDGFVQFLAYGLISGDLLMDGFRGICLWMGLLGNCLAYG